MTGRQWVVHELSGVPEPPEIHWLIGKLTATDRMGSSRAVLEHAHKIHSLLLGRQGRDDHAGHKIRRKNGLWAEPVAAMRGASNDLIRLRTAARSDSDKIWRNGWLAVAGNTRRFVWQPPPPPIIERQFDQDGKLIGFRRERFDASKLIRIKAGRFYSLIPKPADALPLIEAAIRKLDEVPAAERSKRKRDPKFNDLAAIEDELEDAVRKACRELIGRKGFKWEEEEQKYEGPLIDLGRAIDAHFGTKVFTINRLRKKVIPGLKNKKPPRA